jgi:hypothetical protein
MTTAAGAPPPLVAQSGYLIASTHLLSFPRPYSSSAFPPHLPPRAARPLPIAVGNFRPLC